MDQENKKFTLAAHRQTGIIVPRSVFRKEDKSIKTKSGRKDKEKEGRPLRNCPVGNFREEPDCRGGLIQNSKCKLQNAKVSTV
jgi:hypothetical protein